jgi:hypothetical protein
MCPTLSLYKMHIEIHRRKNRTHTQSNTPRTNEFISTYLIQVGASIQQQLNNSQITVTSGVDEGGISMLWNIKNEHTILCYNLIYQSVGGCLHCP